MKKKNVPKIRFPGFTEPWEQRKLSEVLVLLKDGTHGTHKDVSSGPLLLSAKNIKDGEVRWDESDRRISIEDYEKIHAKFKLMVGDVLLTIVGSIGETAIIKHSEEMTFQRSVAFLRPNDEIDSEFLYSQIQNERFQKELDNRKSTSAQPGIYLSDLGEIFVLYPQDKKEQQKIGAYFSKLDNLISLHQRKLENLKKQKKGLLQKMFPEKGKKVPEVRFPEFTDDWEQRKLGEIAERVTRKNTNLESTLPLTISAQYGLVDQITFFNKRVASRDLSNYLLIKKGEFAYNKSYSDGYPFGAIKRLERYDMGVLSSLYIVFKPNNKIINSDYLTTYYDTNCWHKQVSDRAAEGARNHGLLNISSTDFFDTELKFPKELKEQEQIGNFFKKLDNLISLHQRKLEHLQKQKKALLQQMFL